MKQKNAIVAGATGLIGEILVRNLLEDNYFTTIYTISRRELVINNDKLLNYIVDFDQLNSFDKIKECDIAFCCLGTTMKKAGSKAAFYQVDYNYVLAFANYAFQLGCKSFFLVSAMGADEKSLFYYNRVKGEIETAIKEVGFDVVHIMRPSLLLGNRKENRIGEDLGKFIAQTFSFLIPDNYKGIQAASVANYMQRLTKDSQKEGVFIHESAEIRHRGE